MNFHQQISDFYFNRMDLLYADEPFRNLLFTFPLGKPEKTKENFMKLLSLYIEEAKLTVSLIQQELTNNKKSFLEVGGGVGLTYVFLKTQNFNITSIEPSDSGYSNYYQIGIELCRILEVSRESWLPLLGEEVGKLNKQFDVIFSNNVLEHIPNIQPTFAALKEVMNFNGVMIHNTVNYNIPYEPHYNMFLVPIFHRLTEKLKPDLKNQGLWKGLNFITTNKISKICKDLGLKIEFDNLTMYHTFMRFSEDKEFAQRQKFVYPIVAVFIKLRLVNLLKYLPAAMVTPMKFKVNNP